MTFNTPFHPKNLDTTFIANGFIFQWAIQEIPFTDNQDGDYVVEGTLVNVYSSKENKFVIAKQTSDLSILQNQIVWQTRKSTLYARLVNKVALFEPRFLLESIDERNKQSIYTIPINILLNAIRLQIPQRDFITDVGVHVLTRFDRKIELYCSIFERSVEFDIFSNTTTTKDLNRSSMEYSFMCSLIENTDVNIDNVSLLRSIADIKNYFYHTSAIMLHNLTPEVSYIYYDQKTEDLPYADIVEVTNYYSPTIKTHSPTDLTISFITLVTKINHFL